MGILKRLVEGVVAVMFLTFVAVVILQVFYRYVLNHPFIWAEEFVRYIMVWTVMLAGSIAVYNKSHIRLEIADEYLPASVHRWVRFFILLCNLAFLGILSWQGYLYVLRGANYKASVTGVSMGIVYLGLPLGAALMFLFTFSALVEEIQNRGGEKR